MRDLRRVMTTASLLIVALMPLLAAVPREDAVPAAAALPPSRVPVAIAQPLAAIDRPLVGMPAQGAQAMLPESGLLVLVGSALLGLASVVRRTTKA